MNAIAIILTIFNAALLAGSLGGVFMDIPMRDELVNKERVQTTLMQSISERDTEVDALAKRKQELEAEIPLLPGKIEAAKAKLAEREAILFEKRIDGGKSSSTLSTIARNNAAKEREIAGLIRKTFIGGQKGVTVLSATYTSSNTNDTQIGSIVVEDSIRGSDGKSSGFDPEHSIIRLELWDSEKKLGESSISGAGSFTFEFTPDSPLFIKAGESKTLYMKADFADSVSKGKRHRLSVTTITTANPDLSVSYDYLKQNSPIFVFGNTVVPTVSLDDLNTEITVSSGQNVSFSWSLMNPPMNSKVAIVLESSSEKQTVLSKNVSAFARTAKVKIPPAVCAGKDKKCPTLVPGSYTVLAYLYEGADFTPSSKGTSTPTKILSTSREEGKLLISN